MLNVSLRKSDKVSCKKRLPNMFRVRNPRKCKCSRRPRFTYPAYLEYMKAPRPKLSQKRMFISLHTLM